MPNPTDPRAMADDPNGIVQQMPEGDEVIARRAAVAEAYQRGRESGMREAQGIARKMALERRSLHVGQAIAAEILYALSPETDGGQDG